jgi:5-methyltetrahydropteroyltriglutamate--homocysteine methyltransferase
MSTAAPYRADHVGSLLRPATVHDARVRYHAERLDSDGFHTCDELKAIEDDAIRDMVAMQESVGLKAVTDGEMRRSFWHYDFMGALTGLELVERDEGVQFHGMNLSDDYVTTGLPRRSPDARSLPVPEVGHERTAEDLHPGTERLPLPHGARRHRATGVR